MVFRLGQCALLKYKHPSSPILFLTKYSISSLHRIINSNSGLCYWLNCKHPSSPIPFDPKYHPFLPRRTVGYGSGYMYEYNRLKSMIYNRIIIIPINDIKGKAMKTKI